MNGVTCRAVILPIVLFLALLFPALLSPAQAVPIDLNGQSYEDMDQIADFRTYFTATPTIVGHSRSLRFYDSTCPQMDAAGGGALNGCALSRWADTSYPGAFFQISYDGASGATATTQQFFFTVTFAPTRLIDPLDPSIPISDYYLLFGSLTYDTAWWMLLAGGTLHNRLTWEGTVVPVPVAPSVAMGGAGLAALGLMRRRRRVR